MDADWLIEADSEALSDLDGEPEELIDSDMLGDTLGLADTLADCEIETLGEILSLTDGLALSDIEGDAD